MQFPFSWLEHHLALAYKQAKTGATVGKPPHALAVLGYGLAAFFSSYILKGGIFKGRRGWITAWLHGQYIFNYKALMLDFACRPQSYTDDFEPHDVNRQHLPPVPPAPQNPHRLSAVFIVKNEARHLPACLASIADLADEIIVLDSGSTDETESIARHFGAQWHVNRDWQGFGIQRQRAQALATGEWILVLDADEQPDDALKAAIRATIARAPTAETVYALRRSNVFCGHKVHAWYHDAIIRLYSRKHFHYHPYEVHESLDSVTAVIKTLPGALRHYTNDNLYHFLAKNLRYSRVWAEEKAFSGKKLPNLWLLPIKSSFAFFREYILRGAFCGGRYGFLLSASAAFYHFNKYLMLAFVRNKP